MKLSVYILIIVFLSVNCKDSSLNSPSVVKTLSVELSNPKNVVEFSDLFTSVEYIPLETSEECIIGNINKILFYKNIFYIHDDLAKCIYIFDLKGKFISKIGSVGRGPGEYIDLMNFFIDKKNNWIVLDAFYKYQIFDLKTKNFIKEKRYLVDKTEKMYLDNEIFASYMNNIIYGSNKNIVIERQGNFLSSYFPISKTRKGMFLEGDYVFSQNENGNKYLVIPFIDTVYTVVKDIIYPYLYVDFGKKKLPADFFDNLSNKEKISRVFASSYYNLLRNYIETDNYLSFTVNVEGDKISNYFAFKRQPNSYLYSYIMPDSNGIAPPLDRNFYYGNNLWIGSFRIDHIEDIVKIENRLGDSKFMKNVSLDQRKLMEKIIRTTSYKKLKEIYNSVEEDANPVLAVLRLKLN